MAGEEGIKSKIASFDFYKRLPRELTEPSLSGASISLFVFWIMIALFSFEFYKFLQPEIASEMVVDDMAEIKVNINLDIDIHKIPCDILSLDV